MRVRRNGTTFFYGTTVISHQEVLQKKHGTTYFPHTHSLQQATQTRSLSYLTMSQNRIKETTARWSVDDKQLFKEKADAGLIDIDNTTPAYIEFIRLNWWGGRKLDTFRTNYRARAADLQVEREVVAGQREG